MALYSQYCMRITSFLKGTIPFEGALEEAFESGEVKACWTGSKSKGSDQSDRTLRTGVQCGDFWSVKGAAQKEASEKAGQRPPEAML